MTTQPDFVSGTITLTNGSADFTGTSTGIGWQSAGIDNGDTIFDLPGTPYQGVIEAITGDATGTLTKPWDGPTLTNIPYRIRWQPDGSRYPATITNLIELLDGGNLTAFAALTGSANTLPMFDGPGSMTLVTKQDLVSGADYDVQVANIAARAAYDGQAAGFSVLVSNTGDGRAAIYSKNTNTNADWSAPAYVTGPVGPTVTFTAGDTTTLPPGSNATVNVVPVSGGYEMDVGIPAGEGFYNAGVYNIANAYNQSDVVRHNRSSFIALQPVPVGQSPSNVYPPVDTAYWQALVIAGQDGTGTGDVVGPASSVDGQVAIFTGATGKIIRAGTAIRLKLAADLNLYVRTDGNDSNNGLSNTAGGAFLTLAKAASVAWNNYDIVSPYRININVADGTYASNLSISGCPPWFSTNSARTPISFIGNNSTPANVVINGGFAALAGAIFSTSGFKIQSSTAGVSALSASGFGSLIVASNIDFGQMSSTGDHLASSRGGSWEITGAYTISGGAQNHFHVTENADGRAVNATATIPNNITITGNFAGVAGSELNAIGWSYTGAGVVTGSRFLVHYGGNIRLSSDSPYVFPGSFLGTMQSGGMYNLGTLFRGTRSAGSDFTFLAAWTGTFVQFPLTVAAENIGNGFTTSASGAYRSVGGPLRLRAKATLFGTKSAGFPWGVGIQANGVSIAEAYAEQTSFTGAQTLDVSWDGNTSPDVVYTMAIRCDGTGDKTIIGNPLWSSFSGEQRG